ncbi:unnamed protein product [Closterium sp. NIES-53]
MHLAQVLRYLSLPPSLPPSLPTSSLSNPPDMRRWHTVGSGGVRAAPLVASPCPACRVALPCLSRRPAGCRAALLLPAASPCWLSHRPAAACRAALPCPRAAFLATTPPCSACTSPCPTRTEPPSGPHRPAARCPTARAARLLPALLRAALLAGALLPAHRPAGQRPATRAPPCWPALSYPRTALLAAAPLPAPPCPRRSAAARPTERRPVATPYCPRVALLPAHHPAGSRTALPCPRAALLAAALTCVGRVPLFHSRGLPLPALRASLVLERRPACFDTGLDDLQLYLLSDSRDSVSLFDHTSGASLAPPAIADIARYSSPATAALGRLIPPYLFPELSAFATVEDLVTHLRTSDARYRAAVPAKDHFLALDPTALTVDLLEQHLLAAETSIVAVGAARGTPRTPFFEGCSPSPLAPSYASAAAVDVFGDEDVGAGSASGKHRSSKGKGGRGGGGGSGGGGGGGSGGGGGGGGGGSGGSGGRSGGFGGSSGGSGGGGGGSGGGSGSGGGGSGGGRGGAVQRGGSGGGQRQQ